MEKRTTLKACAVCKPLAKVRPLEAEETPPPLIPALPMNASIIEHHCETIANYSANDSGITRIENSNGKHIGSLTQRASEGDEIWERKH